MILNHDYEGATVAIVYNVILYGSVKFYTNFKRSGEGCDKDIKYAEDELGCIFEEIKRV
jgi:hypothetical protein